MKIKMKNGYILTKEVINENVSKHGLILPTEKYNRICTAIKSDSPEISEGDTLLKLIGKGTIFNINGEEYEIIHESSIIAKIK